MDTQYLDFLCTGDTFTGRRDDAVLEFDAYNNYDLLVEFYDHCPECQSFPKEEYFAGDWYDKWTDYVIWKNGEITARAGILQVNDEEWEVAGVITRPEYRNQGLSARIVGHCIAVILEQGKKAILSTAETNAAMIRAATRAGFKIRE